MRFPSDPGRFRSMKIGSGGFAVIEGYVHPDFQEVARVLRRQIPRDGAGGAAVCVYHRGQCVVDAWAGTRDEDGTPWTEDTLVLSYSTTKGVLATLVHRLVERGLLDYDDPVGLYWPAFAQADKARITVRHLLCHEAGLFDVRSLVSDASQMLDWSHMVEALEQSRPVHPPGQTPGYHALTFGWLVGELAQRAGGAPLAELLAREIAEPLGLDGLYIGLPAEQRARRARLIQGRFFAEEGARPGEPRHTELISRSLRRTRLPLDHGRLQAALLPPGIEALDFNAEEVVAAVMPAINGMFTARSLATMYALLAGGGELGGVRLLSPSTLERATRVQSRRMGCVIPLPMEWRLGYHRVPTVRARVPRGFGHCGIGGSGGWADPDRDLAVGLVQNSGLGTPFGDTRIVRIGSAAALAADRR